jgi:hypothetical protein
MHATVADCLCPTQTVSNKCAICISLCGKIDGATKAVRNLLLKEIIEHRKFVKLVREAYQFRRALSVKLPESVASIIIGCQRITLTCLPSKLISTFCLLTGRCHGAEEMPRAVLVPATFDKRGCVGMQVCCLFYLFFRQVLMFFFLVCSVPIRIHGCIVHGVKKYLFLVHPSVAKGANQVLSLLQHVVSDLSPTVTSLSIQRMDAQVSVCVGA